MGADFTGWATKYNVRCTDGRTIEAEAFKHMDGKTVPLVWQHQHNSPENILGHAKLIAHSDGVRVEGFFNDTDQGANAKSLVVHGDIKSLSIYANQLVEKSRNVKHGDIREVSLVLAGANIGAYIDNVAVQHSDGVVENLDDEAVIYSGNELELAHAEEENQDDETLADVLATLNDKQKDAVAVVVAQALGETTDDDEDDSDKDDSDKKLEQSATSADDNPVQHSQEDTSMTRNLFEENGHTATAQQRPTLTHDQLTTIVDTAKKTGSFKEAFLAHAVEYGIENIDLLFPDAKAISNTPELIGRRQEWVQGVLGGARKSPFSRIKSLSADITHDEARAKGYIKGNLKKEEWFGLEKRVTTPTTVYKKQKLDRDDIIDITDLDVVAWLKGEMRLMLDEELARAILVGDGREVDDEDKIREPSGTEGAGIRSIAHDDQFYSHRITVPTGVSGESIIEQVLRGRTKYRGSGTPTAYMHEDLVTDLLLLKDRMGRRLYPTVAELATAMRVSTVVSVPVLEGETVDGGQLLAVIVNMSDYTIGADRGGAISMFDDFDIDYNQYKYLIETRVSGALTRFKSAVVVVRSDGGTEVTPDTPGFNASTGVVTIPSKTGVVYTNAETGATLSSGAQAALEPGDSLYVEAVPAEGYYFPHNTDNDWAFDRPAA